MRPLFALLFCLVAASCAGQCPYDFDSDGTVGNSDTFDMLAVLGTDAPEHDFNSNGLVDILDLIELGRFIAGPCPEEGIPLSDGRIGDLSLVVHHVHETALTDLVDTIPAGSVTYRLYLEVADVEEKILALYGIENAPWVMESSAPWFNHTLGNVSMTPAHHNVSTLTSALGFDTWFTTGAEPELGIEGATNFIGIPDDNLITALQEGTSASAESPVGTALVLLQPGFPESQSSTLRLLGQFTVPEGTVLDGTLNVQTVRRISGDNLSYEIAEGLTFSTDVLGELGCTDADAENYAPTATLNDGTCTYFGDVDDDGEIGASDLLELIGNLGCTTCDDLDLDGDGVVGVGDILLLLGLI